MSKRDAFYDELFDGDSVPLSDDDEINVQNGRRLLGAALVGRMDNAIETALSTIDGDGEFASMTDEQREAVRSLIRETASLMLFSTCSRLDQFPGFDLAIHLRTLPTDDPAMTDFAIASGDHDELHADYFDWIRDFSDHLAEDG
ncbi:hypothetical protein [Novipirellula sp.]|uniref:hypothetical protein n=1 Tax=Novipirellula sp. TaxID=2795430 RepID=UPI0035696035